MKIYKNTVMLRRIILQLIAIICLANYSAIIKAENNHSSGTVDITIPVNTAIPLVLDYSISSKNIKRGDIINFKVAQEIYINDKAAIPMGTLATAEVVKASKRKCWGKGGKLVIKMKELQFANGTTIPLVAPNIEKKGVSKKGNAWTWFWCTILFVPLNTIPPLCIKGENAEIEDGLTIIANTVETITISIEN